jgi:hypothetical protein
VSIFEKKVLYVVQVIIIIAVVDALVVLLVQGIARDEFYGSYKNPLLASLAILIASVSDNLYTFLLAYFSLQLIQRTFFLSILWSGTRCASSGPKCYDGDRCEQYGYETPCDSDPHVGIARYCKHGGSLLRQDGHYYNCQGPFFSRPRRAGGG